MIKLFYLRLPVLLFVLVPAATQSGGPASIDIVANSDSATSDAAMSTAEAEYSILERQLIMQQLDKDAKALGMIVARTAPADKLSEHTRSLAKGAKDAYKSFEARVPGGASKPEVWTNWPDFSKRMQAFVGNAEALAEAGDTGDLNAVSERLVAAVPCKQCHDMYRAKKPTGSGL